MLLHWLLRPQWRIGSRRRQELGGCPEPGDHKLCPNLESGLKEWAIGSGWRWTELLPVTGVLRDRKGWTGVLTALETAPVTFVETATLTEVFRSPGMSQDLGLPHIVPKTVQEELLLLFPLHDSNTTGRARSWHRGNKVLAETRPHSFRSAQVGGGVK